MNVRVIGLMAAAVFAGLVPLVASADPVVAPDAVSGDPAEAKQLADRQKARGQRLLMTYPEKVPPPFLRRC